MTTAYRVTHREWAGEGLIDESVWYFFREENAIALVRKLAKIEGAIELAVDGLTPLWQLGREGIRHLKIDRITFEDTND